MDPRLASLMGLIPQMAPPMMPQAPMAQGVQQPQFPVTPYKPSIMERLFPEQGMEGLLGREAMGGLRRRGLLQAGLSLLANSGESTDKRGLLQLLGQGLQDGQQGYQQALGGAVQSQGMLAQQQQQAARQKALAEISAKYAPVEGESVSQRNNRLAKMVADLIRIDPSLAGQLNAFAPLFRPEEAAPAPKPVQTEIVEVEGQGQLLINKTTGEVIKRLGVKPAPQRGEGKAPTQGQETAAAYAHRMINAESLISDLEDAGVTLPNEALLFSPSSKKGAAIYANLSADQQKLYSILDDWIAAKLRKESGATIQDSEWAGEARRYGRAIGDKPELAPVKRQLRRTANHSIITQAGQAYELPPELADLVDDGRRKKPAKKPAATKPVVSPGRNLDGYFK